MNRPILMSSMAARVAQISRAEMIRIMCAYLAPPRNFRWPPRYPLARNDPSKKQSILRMLSRAPKRSRSTSLQPISVAVPVTCVFEI